MLTVGSLFSGIGGLDLGLERAGMDIIWQVEADEFCSNTLKRRWPGVARYKDVRKVGRHNLESVDLVCGGFPCQDISTANRQGQGIDGERSSLWSEFARLIRVLGPRWVLAENVEHLRWKGRGLGTVLRDLASLGYDAEWETISAAAVGAPHRRRRIFIVAYANDESRLQAGEVFGALRAEGDAWYNAGRRYWASQYGTDWQIPASFTVGASDGIPDRVDRVKALGNAVVPYVAEWIGLHIIQAESSEPC